MPFSALRIYFENPAGRVLEHPDGYAVIEYYPGPRDMFHLQAFLQHTGQLMHLRGWHKLLSDHRVMQAFSAEERDWILNYWLTRQTEGGTTMALVKSLVQKLNEQPLARSRQVADYAQLLSW